MTRNHSRPGPVEVLDRRLEDPAAAAAPGGALDELVALAAALRDIPAAAPSAEFRAELRGRLLAEASAPAPAPVPLLTRLRTRLQYWRRSTSLALASAMGATVISGTAVAAASQHALPGDALYGVKLQTESFRLAMAGGPVESGHLRLVFAERRLDEVHSGARILPPDLLVDTLEAMDESSLSGANALLDAYDRSGDLDILQRLSSFVDRQRVGLTAVKQDLPVQVVPFVHRSLEVVRRIESETTSVVLAGCVPCVDGPFDIPLPGDGPPLSSTRCCAAPAVDAPAAPPADEVAPRRPEVAHPDPDVDDLDPGGEAPPHVVPTTAPTLVPPKKLEDAVGEVTDEVTDTVEDTVSELPSVPAELVDGIDDLLLSKSVGTSASDAPQESELAVPETSLLP